MFKGIWRDLVHAGRSLAKARAFTFVCVVSLGIGMAPVIAIPYGARIFKMPPPGVNTEGLVEARHDATLARARPADAWSYPDFVDLRDADTGMAMTGWASGDKRSHASDSSRSEDGVVRRCSSPPTTSGRSAWRWRGDRDSTRRTTADGSPS